MYIYKTEPLKLTQHCKSTIVQYNIKFFKPALHFVYFSTYTSSLLTLFSVVSTQEPTLY